jgi:excisionase family DNA binding protein
MQRRGAGYFPPYRGVSSYTEASMDQEQQVVRRLHSIRHAGDIIDGSRSTIYRLLAAGELKAVRIGHARRITDESLQEFIRRRNAEAEAGHE